ncbi:MAG: lysozyme [Ruminococcaceae bacterium]|nr:lysozyme [Oscillospiraceae bacterium]MBR3596620.1 glycoside hydrolase family 25 protein [Clostridia bacterium]
MKRVIILIISFSVMLCGCNFTPDLPEITTEEYRSPYATDVNGELVPDIEDVNKSPLNPKLFAVDEKGRMFYNDPEQSLLTGIDVSVFQGDINWQAVKEDGIDFVMLRAGFRGYGSKGIMQKDEKFESNFEGAKAAGLHVGVYFYSQALNSEEAIEEAEFLLEIIDGKELDFPVAYDWEYVDNDEARTKDMTSEKITECALAFCERIKSEELKVVVYLNCELGYFEYDLKILDDYDFWLAEYDHYPSFLYEFKMWQYSTVGEVNGIDGNVDMNVSVVDYSEKVSVG